jgi:hypothetical protein
VLNSIITLLKNKIGLEMIDTDADLTANSNRLIPSQKAVKAYVDTRIAVLPSLTRANGGETVTLPPATGSLTAKYVKQLTAGVVTVVGTGGDTIDGAASFQMTFQYEGHLFVDGAAGKWDVLA